MKNQIKSIVKLLIFGITLMLAFNSCQDDDVNIDIPKNDGNIENAEKIEQIITLKTNLNKIKSMMSVSNSAASSNIQQGSKAESLNPVIRKSTKEDNPEPSFEWISCANTTEVENPDGSFTYTVDYGEGCEEGDELFKIFTFGKYIDTYKYIESEEIELDVYKGKYEGSTTYIDFGSEFENWRNSMSGKSVYSHTFEHSFNTEDGSLTDVSYNNYSDALTIVNSSEDFYEEAEVTSEIEDKFEYSPETGSIVTIIKANYTYVSKESSFSSRVIEPLVMKFDCFDSEIDETPIVSYVSGIEEIEYDTEKYTIDYGDGNCDNLVTITDKDGNKVVMDLLTGEIKE